jgi:DNA-directed RNA polymerase specialized sigma24 family protein
LAATARTAVDELFRLHAVDLVRFALMLVGDQSTAEDVVQGRVPRFVPGVG